MFKDLLNDIALSFNTKCQTTYNELTGNTSHFFPKYDEKLHKELVNAAYYYNNNNNKRYAAVESRIDLNYISVEISDK